VGESRISFGYTISDRVKPNPDEHADSAIGVPTTT